MYESEIRLSFDDAGREGNGSDDVRLAKLLKKYGFSKNVTFYCMPFQKDLIKYLAKDFKIGAHTVTHPQDLKLLNDEQARWEIEESKAILEKISEHKVKSFCYPRGRYGNREIRYVKNAGFKEARTTIVGCIEKPDNPFRLDTSAHICPERPEYTGTTWFKEAKKLFDKVINGEGDYWHCWGHSEEINRYKLWDKFKELLYYIKSKL